MQFHPRIVAINPLAGPQNESLALVERAQGLQRPLARYAAANAHEPFRPRLDQPVVGGSREPAMTKNLSSRMLRVDTTASSSKRTPRISVGRAVVLIRCSDLTNPPWQFAGQRY